jgi:hypothetical protein
MLFLKLEEIVLSLQNSQSRRCLVSFGLWCLLLDIRQPGTFVTPRNSLTHIYNLIFCCFLLERKGVGVGMKMFRRGESRAMSRHTVLPKTVITHLFSRFLVFWCTNGQRSSSNLRMSIIQKVNVTVYQMTRLHQYRQAPTPPLPQTLPLPLQPRLCVRPDQTQNTLRWNVNSCAKKEKKSAKGTAPTDAQHRVYCTEHIALKLDYPLPTLIDTVATRKKEYEAKNAHWCFANWLYWERKAVAAATRRGKTIIIK